MGELSFNKSYTVTNNNAFPNPLYSHLINIGSALDSINCVLLVASYISGELNDFKGILGKLYGIRGNKSAYNVSFQFDVICTYAYNYAVFDIATDNKIGTCRYNEATYIAVQLPKNATYTLLFSGIHSKDCVFKIVRETDIQWTS